MGKLGWIAAFVYCAAAALRLARFNTMLAVQDKRWFMGLPSPAAAALVAAFVWLMVDNQAMGERALAGLERHVVCRHQHDDQSGLYSGKDFNLKRSVPFVVVVLIALGFH
jgi:CDP-diacylglycerol---serine O-phosphatidyltransferase